MFGSSPLARGLPGEGLFIVYASGIIPARAGFTLSLSELCRCTPDHPRSRGVYVRGERGEDCRGGSSPLARGLHARVVAGDREGRIIPARAGFTRPASRSSTTPGDHPRSRGVYRYRPVELDHVGGSSPLARGLRARATRASPMRTDHPRSRGVYKSVVQLSTTA